MQFQVKYKKTEYSTGKQWQKSTPLHSHHNEFKAVPPTWNKPYSQ